MKFLLALLIAMIFSTVQAAQIDARFMTTGFNTLFSGKSTDDLSEGSTNLYYTDARFDTAFSGKSTSDLAEGTNKYYTATQARSDVLSSTLTSGDSTHALTNGALYSLIGSASGIAPLDGSGKIAASFLPSSLMNYQGAWDASTNTPTLADGTGTNGDVYRVSVAGSQDLGSGSHAYAVADFIIYNGSVWQYSPAADGVVSVNGLDGVVVLDTDDISEGSTNKYYASSLFDTDFGLKTTDNLAQGLTNYYYSTSLFDADFGSKTTDALTEGTNNKYYSETLFNTSFSTKSTDDLSEGASNKYYTDTLARNALSVTGTALSYNSGTGEFSCNSASSSTDGCLSSGDWSTFNNKQDQLTFSDLSTNTTGVTVTGGSQAVIGASGVQVDIATADSTNTGLLSASDWNRFDASANATPVKEVVTLVAGDITNQYVDLSYECKASSLVLILKGASAIAESLDYSTSVVANKTRISFIGDIASAGATPVIAGDVFYAQCVY